MAQGKIGATSSATGATGSESIIADLMQLISDMSGQGGETGDLQSLLAGLKSNQGTAASQATGGPDAPSDDSSPDSSQGLMKMLLELLLLFMTMMMKDLTGDDSSTGGDSGGSGTGDATPAAAKAASALPASGPKHQQPGGTGGVGTGDAPGDGATVNGGAKPAPGSSSAPPGGNVPQAGALTPAESQKAAVDTAARLQADFGFTKEQAAGVVGNLYHESFGMNANINEIGSGPESDTYGAPNSTEFGYGLAQWSGSRKTDYENFATDNGLQIGSSEASYQFLKSEMQGSEAASVKAVKATNTAADAAVAFRSSYERAANPVDPDRIANANQILAWIS